MAKGAISWVGFILWFELNVINIKIYPLSRFKKKKITQYFIHCQI